MMIALYNMKMKVLGVGDNVVDRYVNKDVMFPGGNAVNFAVYASKCGAEASYLGIFANDIEGKLVRNSLVSLGIDISNCEIKENAATERCDVNLVEGDRVFIDTTYGPGEWTPLKIKSEMISYIDGFDVVHCGCYAAMEDEMYKLKDVHGFKTYDFSEEREYRTNQYLKKICPYIDMALFSGSDMDEDEEIEIREKVTSLGARYVLVTRGADGQKLWDGQIEHEGCVNMTKPVDTMGAGDSFFAAFVVETVKKGIANKKSLTARELREAFEYAAWFSAQNCLSEGSFGFKTAFTKG